MSKHVAVLMGGWSAEREVSLALRQGLRRGAERGGYQVTRIDVGRDIAAVLQHAQARRRAQRAARPAGRGRHAARRARNSRHPLQPFRRAGVGGGDAEGPRQGRLARRRHAGAGGTGVVAPRGGQGHLLPPPYVIKPVAEGSSVGVFIVTRGSRASAAGTDARRLGIRRAVLVESYIPGKELTCAVMGDGRSASSKSCRRRGSTTTRRNTRRAAQSICCRRRFHRLFTRRSEDSRWRRIARWAAAA